MRIRRFPNDDLMCERPLGASPNVPFPEKLTLRQDEKRRYVWTDSGRVGNKFEAAPGRPSRTDGRRSARRRRDHFERGRVLEEVAAERADGVSEKVLSGVCGLNAVRNRTVPLE